MGSQWVWNHGPKGLVEITRSSFAVARALAACMRVSKGCGGVAFVVPSP